MDKTRIAVVASLLISTAACFASNPLIGTWRFNEAKSKLAPGVTRNHTIVYAQQGDMIKVTTDGTDADGTPVHSVWVAKFDGKSYPVKGSHNYNAAGIRVIDEHTQFIQGLKNGKLMWWGTITVSKDGKTRTATLRSIGANGKKFTVKKVYDRI